MMLKINKSIYHLVILVCVGFNVSLKAEQWPSGTFEYDVDHDRYGNIGVHTVTLKQRANVLVVEAKSRVKVDVLFWSYRFEADQKEVWNNGRLIEYKSSTRDDLNKKGETLVVTARAAGDKLIIKGPNGRVEAPGNIYSSHPWNPDIVQQSVLMEAKTGELKSVGIESSAVEELYVADKHVKARKYIMTGELQRELWYDQSGKCIQTRFKDKDGYITIKLVKATVNHEPMMLSKLGP